MDRKPKESGKGLKLHVCVETTIQTLQMLGKEEERKEIKVEVALAQE